MAHTMGPWRAEGFKNLIVNAANGETITCYPHGKTTEETAANAQLIAAAPDLLAVCKGLLEFAQKCDISLCELGIKPPRTSTNAFPGTDIYGVAAHTIRKAGGE